MKSAPSLFLLFIGISWGQQIFWPLPKSPRIQYVPVYIDQSDVSELNPQVYLFRLYHFVQIVYFERYRRATIHRFQTVKTRIWKWNRKYRDALDCQRDDSVYSTAFCYLICYQHPRQPSIRQFHRLWLLSSFLRACHYRCFQLRWSRLQHLHCPMFAPVDDARLISKSLWTSQ